MSDTTNSDLAQRQLTYVNEVMDKTGWTRAVLCKRANISPSTLSVFMNGKREGHVLNSSTIERIERASGVAFDGRQIATPFPKAQTIDDAIPFEQAHAPGLFDSIEALLQASPGRSAYTLRTGNMTLAGYASGDVIVCDPGMQPADGDLVMALSGSEEGGRKRTVVRLHHHPYLVSAGNDPHSRWPIVVDRWSTKVTAVVIASLRGRNQG